MTLMTRPEEVMISLKWSKKLNCRSSRVSLRSQQEEGRGAHLEDVVTQLEKDGVLHPVVLDQKVHVLAPLDVLELPLDVAAQRLGHVVLEVAQEVRLAVEIFGNGREGVVSAGVDVCVPVRDVVKVSAGRDVSTRAVCVNACFGRLSERRGA